MSIEESLRLIGKGEVAVLEWDLIGEKVNKLSSPIMFRFKELLEQIKSSDYKALVLISRKSKIFIAGADIDEIKKINSKEEFLKVLEPAHEVFNLLEDLPIPTIAAIHGACLGGGCELVSACDYRICSDDKSTKIGLPEVKLGIIPGFGGCVRLPRIVGLQQSLDIILAGKAVPAAKAKKIGLVDEVLPSAKELEERALKMAEEAVKGERRKRRKIYRPKSSTDRFLESFMGRPIVFSQAKKTIFKNTKGFYPAPLKALEVIKDTYKMSDRSKALGIERKAFAEVAPTEVSKYLIDLFYMMEAVKKQNGVPGSDIKGKEVKRMGVLGAGTMGGGIAHLGADKGIHVKMKDINNQALAIGYKHAHDLWKKAMDRRRLTKYEMEERMSHMTGSLDFQNFSKLDLVVEAIVEDMEIKKKVLAETATHCQPNCIFATNTSSLSVTEMAEAVPQPENFVGMHFFNPVHKMPLVEVIRGSKTGDEATATVFELAKAMGKTPVVVKDGPGFLVNRLLMPWMIEGMFMLEDGMSIEKVDRYYTHKFGMPMGPYRLMDEVGLDVCLKVVKIFKKALGERIEVPSLVEKLETTDRLGKKNGKGFYLYDKSGKQLCVDKNIYSEMGLKEPTDPLEEKECLQRGIFQMINEGALALVEDRIVETPQDLDLAMIMGTGFPPFRGGLLKYADSLGSTYVVQELELYASKCGHRFRPCQPLVNMAKTDRKFY